MRNILLVCLWCVGQLVCAQNVNFYDDRQIGSQIINAFCQDSDDFIWIGTRQGLRRFDGVDFVAYYHSGQDSTSLADNEVHSLCVDRSRRLWVGTANGLQCYVPENDAFRLVTFQGVSLKGRIHDIIQLDNGDIVCVVANVGIFRVDAQTMQGYPLWVESDVFTPGNSYSLFEDSRKRLWIGTDREGVVCVDLDSHMERRYASSFSTVNDMVEGHDGCMYVVSPQGVFRRDEPSDRFFPLSYDGDGEGMLCQTAMQTKDGHLLVATYGHGVLRVSQDGKRLVDDGVFRNAFFDARRAKVNALFEDRQQNLWAGCQYQGVLVSRHRATSFVFWKSPAAVSGIPGHINVLYCDGRNNLWCTVEGNGIYQMDGNGGVLRHIPMAETVFSMYEDSNGTLWAGVEGKGLCRVDHESGLLETVCPVKGDFYIRSIAEDRHKRLYVAVTGAGVLCYDLSTGQTQTFPLGTFSEKEGGGHNWVGSIFCDSDERIWFGHFGRVCCYDLKGGRFLDLPFGPDIRSSSFYAFAEGDDHSVWMATRDGLVCYDPRSNRYSVMTAAQGLPDDFVCSVVKDRKGDLWCATMKGISHIDPETREVVNYYAGNGLQENFYLEGRCAQGKDGTIYLGGGKGITSFDPEKMQPVGWDSAPCITDMYIYDKRVTPQTFSGGEPVIGEAVVHATDFHLAYSDNTFTLKVSTMDYRDAGSVFYEYRMEEFGEGWNRTLPGENRIQYHHLAPGSYTLQLRACENGAYSPVKSVQVHIAPPWYLTWAAKAAYVLFALGAGFLAYAAIRRRRREKIGEMKLQFFINIAHEIRSPLTLILAPLEKLQERDCDEETRKLLFMIRYNAGRILNLLNQLLDIRKIEKGQMRLHFAETDMNKFLGNLLDVFSGQARQKVICLTADFETGLPKVWIDPRHFDKVLVNLLMNALKYTSRGGSIQVSVSTGCRQEASGGFGSIWRFQCRTQAKD